MKRVRGSPAPVFENIAASLGERKTYAWPTSVPWNWQVLERVSVLFAASRARRSLRKPFRGRGGSHPAKSVAQEQWGGGSPSL